MTDDDLPDEVATHRPQPARIDRHARELSDSSFALDAIPWLADVRRFARSLARNDADADDIAQETFLRAYRFWHTFVPESDCRRWLFAICRNTFLRKVQRDRVVESAGDDAELEALAAVRLHIVARDAGLNDMFDRFDLGPAIVRAIEALPAAYRTAVQLVDVEGMTYEEVANALAVPVGTIRSRLYRGRRLLQQQLIEYARDAGFVTAREVTVLAAPKPLPERGIPR